MNYVPIYQSTPKITLIQNMIHIWG